MDAARHQPNIDHWEARADLAAAFRWTARMDMNEAVANHFSLAVNPEGTQFLMNPNLRHFSPIRASELLLIDANDPGTLSGPNAPDPTAWGLHGALHRRVPHARCALHVHSQYATALACLADSRLPPIDQMSAMFYGPRQVIDTDYGGLAFEEEGERCAALFTDPAAQVMVMGNHGVMVIGASVAQAFNRLYYFERAARTYITALQTGQKLRILSDRIAEATAKELDAYPEQGEGHLAELRAILDEEGANYAT